MKNHLLFTLFFFFISSLCHAQNITLWGCTLGGGQYNYGTVLNYNVGAGSETDLHDFAGHPTDGANPQNTLIRANNGLLYGTTGTGGAYGGGTIFSYNISTGIETDLHDFSGGADGASPHDALIQATNGLLYGVTQTGGAYNLGVIFSYDIAIGIETIVYDFKGGTTDGNNPLTSLFQASNGLIYGATEVGGAYDYGIIYSYNITTGVETDLYDFGSYSTDAKQPYCTFTEVNDSLLYGTTVNGGGNDKGTIFKYNILTGKYTVIYSFNSTTDGINPQYLTFLNVGDSMLYGTAVGGGIYGHGVIFSYSIFTGVESVVYSFGNGTDGKIPENSIIQASNGLLYGTTYQGGIYGGVLGYGTIYSYDIATGTENDVYNFGNATDGRNPDASLIEVDTATISVAPVAICAGGSTVLIANGSTAYTWSPAAGLSATTGDTVIASPTVTTTYTITGTGAVPTYPTTVTVTVTPNPTITVNTPLTVCLGAGATLTASGGKSYTWSPYTGLSATTGSSVVANPTVTTVYSVTAYSNGCTAATTDTVRVVTAPPLITKPQDTTVCKGQSVTLSVPVSGSGYLWSPSLTLSSSKGYSVLATPLVTTTYAVTGKDSLGCIVSGLDTVHVTQGPNTPVITKNGNVLTSTATQGNQWYRNDTLISGATDAIYNVIALGCYSVVASNPANGCSTTSDTVCITTLAGIDQLSATRNQLSIYPNPTSNQLTIISNQKSIQKIEIDNVLGETMLVYVPQFNKAGTAVNLDVSHLADRMYFVRVTSNGEMVTRKVIVSR